ncbi:hypothetical protein LY78DRAFT_661281, partial [Colletotrichum sublineola]
MPVPANAADMRYVPVMFFIAIYLGKVPTSLSTEPIYKRNELKKYGLKRLDGSCSDSFSLVG